MTVHIVCATWNGARFLPDFLASLEGQTHRDWQLLVRDDDSTDGSRAILESAAGRDARITLLPPDGEHLGSTGSFGRLLQTLPTGCPYVMFADQDDVWLPDKIDVVLAAMRRAEAVSAARTPVLVHSDLTVVDSELNVLHPSFWALAGIGSQVDAPPLRRLVVGNVVTGAASMLNGALRELSGALPPEAIQHDWWCACVAAAFGRVVAVHESTMLYRQHGGNEVGARDNSLPLRTAARSIVSGLQKTSEFRAGVRRTAAQARAFLERYGTKLTASDAAFLRGYAALPDQPFLRRKLSLLRFRRLPDQGLLRTLGAVLRG